MQPLSARVIDRLNDTMRLDVVSRRTPAIRNDDSDLAALCEAAALALNTCYGFFSFIHADHQRLVGCYGMDCQNVPIEQSIFVHGMGDDEIGPLIIPDLAKDDRFQDSPLLNRTLNLRFYAGFPVLIEGELVGTLCVADRAPREEQPHRIGAIMERLSQVASALIASKEAELRAAQMTLNLVRSQRRHDLALRAARVATWTWNRETNTVEADRLFRRMLDVGEDTDLAIADVETVMKPAHRSALIKSIANSLDDDREFSVEAPLLNERTVSLFGRVLDLPDQAPNQQIVYGVAIDVTDRQLADEKRRQLLRELNHRVRNTLAMLQSLAGQTMRRSASAEEFNAAFSGRLQALSNAHHLLTEQDWDAVEVHELLRQQMDPLLGEKRHRVAISGNSATIGAEESVGLALIVHELTTNALRHGALADGEGSVAVQTDIVRRPDHEEAETICIDWRESSAAVACLEETGFGLLLIKRSLDKVIGATVDVEQTPAGVHAHIAMPLNRSHRAGGIYSG
ncbi:HWE histidine kinase domain-containing protein [Notoacmeibacter marinus]|uniref:HWE histidine kinase domain-containing protein n=1 Tax=Notoacmeibacter marinus TaxID=1876515 RepID=UPI000DF2B73D|nr:HWE histidine kinase domain-containing protein [Notoacmeibacter marinus]